MNSLTYRITLAKKLQNPKRFLMSFSAADISPQLVAMNIVKRQPVPHAVWSCVCRTQTNRLATPALTGLRANLQRPELVEGHRRTVGGRRGVYLRTAVGGVRPVVMLEGVQLPRIC
jgi:hypothetical protein